MIVIGLGANMPSKCGAPAATLIATSDPEEALEAADRIFSMERHNLVPWAAEPLREAS